jgi:hypothetical protein
MLYDKPVAELMRSAAEAIPEPMSTNDLIEWFGAHYPKVQSGTVRAHVIGLTANNPTKRHYPSLARRSPIFFQIGRGQLLRFDISQHETDATEPDVYVGDEDESLVRTAPTEDSETTMEFALEAYLEEFIVTNWDLIDWGRRLAIWEGADGQIGHQLATPVGRLDLLAHDLDTNELVIIELKRGRTSDQVVGQAARYMGWVRAHLAEPEQNVSGIVIAGQVDEKLRYAAMAVSGLSVRIYQVSFTLERGS